MDLNDALSDALASLARAQAERDRLDAVVSDLAVEVDGLRKAIERHDVQAVEVIDPPEQNPWPAMPRTEAILAVLGNEPMSPNDIVTQLHKLGRDDEYNAVSAALAHLQRSGRAMSMGRGQWVSKSAAGRIVHFVAKTLAEAGSQQLPMAKPDEF
jgi:hypothetical protein